MADANGVNDSSLAPTDFPFYTSLESSGDLAVAIERCPLCLSSRKPFICQICISNGHITHSSFKQEHDHNSVNLAQHSFLFKKNLLVKKSDKALRLLQRVQDLDQNSTTKQKVTDIYLLKQQLPVLRTVVEDEKAKVLSKKSKLKNTQDSNLAQSHSSDVRNRKRHKIAEYISHIQHKNETKQSLLSDIRGELTTIRSVHIKRLVSVIFPVEEVTVPRESDVLVICTPEPTDDASELTQQSLYVTTEPSTCHRIVESFMSSSGDLSLCSLLVTEKDVDKPQGKEDEENTAHMMMAGLAYMAQLTNCLARVLDLCLPKRVSYRNFALSKLTENGLANYIARLKYNVGYLCISQGLEYSVVDIHQPAQSLFHLIRDSRLARNTPCAVDVGMFVPIERDIVTSEDSEDEFSTENDDDTNDWEVTECIDDVGDIPGAVGAASSIISAAASVFSFWRAGTYDRK